ncbi:hypothetical protein GCM10027048_20300 [Hymenobacter coalescens]
MDFSALPSRLKDYTVKESDNILSEILIDGHSFLDYVNLLPDVTDEIDLMQMFIDSVLQPGGKDTFDPKGTFSFKKRTGKVRDCKIDFTLTPKQINTMWKSFMGRINKSKRGDVYDVPFWGFLMEQLAKKGKQELHLDAFFKGVYNGDSTKANRVFDGILPLMSDAGAIPAGNIYSGAPITQLNAIDQLEGLADKVPSDKLQWDIVALVEPEVMKFYNRDYRATYGGLNYNNEFKHTLLDGTNITLVAEPGLAQTSAVIMTPRENISWLTGELTNTDSFIVEKSKRNINIMMDFQAAPDFALGEYIWTNDLALTKGTALRTAAAAE